MNTVPTWMQIVIYGCALVLACTGALCDCGGDAFTAIDPRAAAAGDAGELADDAHPAMMSSPGDDDAASKAGGQEADGGRALAPVDAGGVAPPDTAGTFPPDGSSMLEHDAGDVDHHDAASALCCMTPCSGWQVSPITCGNGPAWTCAAGSCSDLACSVGGTCNWMGSICTGHVAVCP